MSTQSIYKRGAKIDEAPNIFDCSSFTKYCYSLIGIDLPRNSIQQSYYYLGSKINLDSELQVMDLFFTRGYINRFINNHHQGVGHVLLYTGKEKHTVIHASNKQKGVIEESADKYLYSPRLVQINRYIEDIIDDFIMVHSSTKNFETSDDIFWKIAYTINKT